MAITLAEVDRIAKLARLSFSEEEKVKLQKELSAILDYVDQLKTVEAKVEERPYDDPESVNRMRDDFAQNLTSPDELLKIAPEVESGYYKVKSVLE